MSGFTWVHCDANSKRLAKAGRRQSEINSWAGACDVFRSRFSFLFSLFQLTLLRYNWKERALALLDAVRNRSFTRFSGSIQFSERNRELFGMWEKKVILKSNIDKASLMSSFSGTITLLSGLLCVVWDWFMQESATILYWIKC